MFIQAFNNLDNILRREADLFDVLAFIRFALPPVTRAERVASRKDLILSDYNANQQEFLNYVLDSYVQVGVQELGTEKLGDLIKGKYGQPADAVSQLGAVPEIRDLFLNFQQKLYQRSIAA